MASTELDEVIEVHVLNIRVQLPHSMLSNSQDCGAGDANMTLTEMINCDG